MGKMKSIFELASNLTLVLTKLDTELGLAQPQLVSNIDTHILFWTFPNFINDQFVNLNIKNVPTSISQLKLQLSQGKLP